MIMTIKNRSRITVFILSFLVWLTLTHISDIQEVIAGLIVAIIVSAVAGKFLINNLKIILALKYYFLKFILKLE